MTVRRSHVYEDAYAELCALPGMCVGMYVGVLMFQNVATNTHYVMVYVL